MILERLELKELFGYADHTISFRPGRVTIITGPNGSGKTHILRILQAITTFDLFTLSTLPFRHASLTFRSGDRLDVHRSAKNHIISFSSMNNEGKDSGSISVPFVDRDSLDLPELPPWIQQISATRWLNIEDGEELTLRQLQSSFGHATLFDIESTEEWLDKFVGDSRSLMIETSRLNAVALPERSRRYSASALGRVDLARRGSPVDKYVARISQQMTAAKGRSLRISQQSDRRFAPRALDRARESIRESDLRTRFTQISELNSQLSTVGLIEQTLDLAIPVGRLNPTERRIINVFLEDWEEKLQPLLPIRERLQLLLEIVGSKILGKEMAVRADGSISFQSLAGEVPVSQLSSGEQHLIALFTMMLFGLEDNSLVLIDEPEISLHAAWKHEFIPDMQRIASTGGLQLVMATHSSALINSRWDLVEELV